MSRFINTVRSNLSHWVSSKIGLTHTSNICILISESRLDGLKEGRENTPVEENSPVIKKQINSAIELFKKHKIRPYSLLRI
jgi:hypothetical protein